jgi:hypothetical protein
MLEYLVLLLRLLSKWVRILLEYCTMSYKYKFLIIMLEYLVLEVRLLSKWVRIWLESCTKYNNKNILIKALWYILQVKD